MRVQEEMVIKGAEKSGTDTYLAEKERRGDGRGAWRRGEGCMLSLKVSSDSRKRKDGHLKDGKLLNDRPREKRKGRMDVIFFRSRVKVWQRKESGSFRL